MPQVLWSFWLSHPVTSLRHPCLVHLKICTLGSLSKVSSSSLLVSGIVLLGKNHVHVTWAECFLCKIYMEWWIWRLYVLVTNRLSIMRMQLPQPSSAWRVRNLWVMDFLCWVRSCCTSPPHHLVPLCAVNPWSIWCHCSWNTHSSGWMCTWLCCLRKVQTLSLLSHALIVSQKWNKHCRTCIILFR